MIWTSTSASYHVTTSLAHSPNGSYPDLAVGNRCGQLCHGQSYRTLHSHPRDTTRVSSCLPQNVARAIMPTTHHQGLIWNALCDGRYLLSMPTA